MGIAILGLGILYIMSKKKVTNGLPYIPYLPGPAPVLPNGGVTATPEEVEESRILTRRTRRVTSRVKTFVIPMTKYRPGSEDLIVEPGVQSPIPGNIQAMLAYGIEA